MTIAVAGGADPGPKIAALRNSMFRFYEEVRIAAPRPENLEHAGELGALVGLGDEPGQPVSYGVFLYRSERVVCFAAEELAATGRQFTREDFYRSGL